MQTQATETAADMTTAAEALSDLLRRLSQRPPSSSTPTLTRPSEAKTVDPAQGKPKPLAGACSACGGAGFVVADLPHNDPGFGKLVRCGACANYLATCRLSTAEQRLTIDDLKGRPGDEHGYALVMRFLGKQMLADPFGFLSVTGVKGAGKSMISAALVATFARNGRDAVYYTASEIAAKLTDWSGESADIPGDPSKFCERLKRAAVLAIDELDKIRWSQWIVRTLGDVLDYRHRHAEELVTILTMNHGPERWPTEKGVYIEHIASRLADGRFNRFWPEAHRAKLPACLANYYDVDAEGNRRHYAPGLFVVSLPDVRPSLRRQAQEVT
jgi:hypothetical protein